MRCAAYSARAKEKTKEYSEARRRTGLLFLVVFFEMLTKFLRIEELEGNDSKANQHNGLRGKHAKLGARSS
jgi:hypothetical protein